MRIWLSLLIGFMVGGSVSQAVNALPGRAILEPATGVCKSEEEPVDHQVVLAKVMNIILEVLQGQNAKLDELDERVQKLEAK